MSLSQDELKEIARNIYKKNIYKYYTVGL